MLKLKRTHFYFIVLLLVIFLTAGVVAAHGQSPAQLGNAGWTCFNAGPNNWVHCFPPGTGHSANTINIKVFETTDVGAQDAEYLGTELLLHTSIYHQQGCPQEGLATYENLYPSTGMPYFACHHFDVDNHH